MADKLPAVKRPWHPTLLTGPQVHYWLCLPNQNCMNLKSEQCKSEDVAKEIS